MVDYLNKHRLYKSSLEKAGYNSYTEDRIILSIFSDLTELYRDMERQYEWHRKATGDRLYTDAVCPITEILLAEEQKQINYAEDERKREIRNEEGLRLGDYWFTVMALYALLL